MYGFRVKVNTPTLLTTASKVCFNKSFLTAKEEVEGETKGEDSFEV